MRVIFMHPRDSGTFEADVDDDTSAQTCIDNLVSEKFLPREAKDQPYTLTLDRTQKQILKTMTMSEAGARDNDTISIIQQERGA